MNSNRTHLAAVVISVATLAAGTYLLATTEHIEIGTMLAIAGSGYPIARATKPPQQPDNDLDPDGRPKAWSRRNNRRKPPR